MSALTKGQILAAMNSDSLEQRLVITPLLNPKAIDSASVDVRLGTEFIIIKKQSFPLLDIAQPQELESGVIKYQQKMRINYGDRLVLHPRQLIIGSTFEYIQIPPNLMCYVIGKSSWGRMGLIIATATKVDPEFRGCITLEIINEGEVPVVLYPGIPIAQLVFHNALPKLSPNNGYNGAYQYSTGPKFPSFPSNNKDWVFWTTLNKKKNNTPLP